MVMAVTKAGGKSGGLDDFSFQFWDYPPDHSLPTPYHSSRSISSYKQDKGTRQIENKVNKDYFPLFQIKQDIISRH